MWFGKSARLHHNLRDHKARENSTFEAVIYRGDYPINWLSVWYRPAPGETEVDRQMLAERIVTTQIDDIRS